jgi:hypothetical protein
LPKKVDANQKEIVAALRQMGATVWITSDCGHGAPDIICGYSGRSYLFELKSSGGRMTTDEIEWRDKWRGNYYVITTAEQAIEIMQDDEY